MSECKLTYQIDSTTLEMTARGKFRSGNEQQVLSSEATDPTFSCAWYGKGYSTERIFHSEEFQRLKNEVASVVEGLLSEITAKKIQHFRLEDYHKYVKTNEEHYQIVKKTRDLFPSDFALDIGALHKKLSSLVGFPLTDIDPSSNEKVHIIIRINRPKSQDYNPPHKDMYAHFDGDLNGSEKGHIPNFINFWIPIAGVTAASSLPLAPSSHQIPEHKILRTESSSVINGKNYHVGAIQSWDGQSLLTRPHVDYGEVLVFSSHLIHGAAANFNADSTRVAFEFRLFKS